MYHVHKTLLEQQSEYFDRVLNGNWQEPYEGVVTLDDVDCNTYALVTFRLSTKQR